MNVLLKNILKTHEGRIELTEKIKKDKKAKFLIRKILFGIKIGTFENKDLIVCSMRYAANGMYEKDYPGVYKKWARTWYRDYYLQSPHWYKFRSYILNRHDGKCELCKRSAIRLDIHHRSYENLFIEKRKDVLIICRDCHSKIHPE